MSFPSRVNIWSKLVKKGSTPGGALTPDFYLQLGGALAVYGEPPVVGQDQQIPWMVFHGGPGGRISMDLVKPLRQLGLGWFGFDQRNSGLSEDLKASDLDLQLFVDDAVQLIAHLGCDKVNILAGSWGATVAMLLAVQQPQLIDRMVLRAPFIPFTSRIDNFFEHLESVAPKWFASVFGKNARTFEVCSQMLDNHDLDEQFNKAYCWSSLEEVALEVRSANSLPSSENIQVQFSKDHANRLLRKYLLQSHFFVSSCLWAEGDWFKNMKELNKSNIRVSIAQGLDDKVCPPDGALIIKEQFTKVELTFLESGGHLANSPSMISALVNFISR